MVNERLSSERTAPIRKMRLSSAGLVSTSTESSGHGSTRAGCPETLVAAASAFIPKLDRLPKGF
jgi:hypothetical protein